MNGYVKNMSPGWVYALKRSFRPGGEVTLDELYEQYGKKHNIPEGEPFVEWLTTIKLKDKNRWQVSTVDSVPEEPSKEVREPTIKEMEIEDIVQLSVRKAREILPKMTDIKLLKYALREASPRAGKDSLCLILRKRIRELELSRAM